MSITIVLFLRYMKVIVLWTATTERFSSVETGLNDTADNLLASIKVSSPNCSVFLQTIFCDGYLHWTQELARIKFAKQ